MTELVKYSAAERALAEAVAVDEVLDVRSQAEAMRIYAQQAKNLDLEIKAAQLRFRAERRLGDMIAAQKETVGLNRGRAGAGRPALGDSPAEQPKPDDRPTLAEAGIDRKLSMRAQKMAALPPEKFNALVGQHGEEMRAGTGRISMDLLKLNSEVDGRAHRRDLAAALSTTSVMLPTGRQYPGGYIDCPWKREGGIGDRAYENHYPTMSWPEILEFLRKAKDSFLPDAWAFFWIPRAHLLAPIEVELEVTVASTGERVQALVETPLAAACAQALGFDYSTCFVWTKTDADHPDVSGSGLIAWDQDELLLLFKRGRGLPKPSGAEKYGSNHRERATDHSRKPEHYRRMIADMVGCDSAGEPLPVLEMFARVDAEHPLPKNWDACGNQAGVSVAAQSVVDIPTGAASSPSSAEYLLECVRNDRIVCPGPDERDCCLNVDDNDLAAELPSAAETVTAAADTTSDGASAAAAVTEFIPAFPETELADLCAYRDQVDDAVARLDHAEYLRRGLIHDWLGKWRVTPQGEIRVNVLTREMAEREARFKARLEQQDFWDWRDLGRIAARMPLDSGSMRSVIGLGLADINSADDVYLTDAGRARLAEIEAMVEDPAPALPPLTPYQLDLEQFLQQGVT